MTISDAKQAAGSAAQARHPGHRIGVGDLVIVPAPKGCWRFHPLGDVLDVDNSGGTACVRHDNHEDDGPAELVTTFALTDIELATPLHARPIMRTTGGNA